MCGPTGFRAIYGHTQCHQRLCHADPATTDGMAAEHPSATKDSANCDLPPWYHVRASPLLKWPKLADRMTVVSSQAFHGSRSCLSLWRRATPTVRHSLPQNPCTCATLLTPSSGGHLLDDMDDGGTSQLRDCCMPSDAATVFGGYTAEQMFPKASRVTSWETCVSVVKAMLIRGFHI